jgi:hypothetical protein
MGASRLAEVLLVEVNAGVAAVVVLTGLGAAAYAAWVQYFQPPDPRRQLFGTLAWAGRSDAGNLAQCAIRQDSSPSVRGRVADSIRHADDVDHMADPVHADDVRAEEDAGRDRRGRAPLALRRLPIAERGLQERLP